MSRIPIASLANGVLFATQPFASPSNPAGVAVLTPAVGVVCMVYLHDTTTAATVFSDEVGSTVISQPLISDSTGAVPGWIDPTGLPLDLVTGGKIFVLAGGVSSGGGGGGGGVQIGGDIGGTDSAPVVQTVKGGKAPLTADQNLVDLSSAAAARANLGLGSIAVHSTTDFEAAGTAVSVVATETSRATAAEALLAPIASPVLTGSPSAPTASPGNNTTQLATTAFVTAAVQASQAGLLVHTAAKVATVAALPSNTYSAGVLTAASNGALTVDGISVSVNDRVLVKNETTSANNGVYGVTTVGDGSNPYVLTRVSDMNSGAQVPGAFVFVQSGAVNTGAGFSVVGAGPFTIGTTPIPWTQFSGAGQITAGLAVSITGNQISAVLGTTGSSAAAGNDTRITGAAQKANNLSDLSNAATARTNLGLGTAATQSTTAFDAAGSAAAAQAAAQAVSVPLAEIGAVNGVASLDSSGSVPVGELGNIPIGPVFVQNSPPSPSSGFGQYIWFEMDGGGHLLDIQTGIA